MAELRTLALAVVGAVLASVVLFGAVTTSRASFTASTRNESNLWEAAEISLGITDTDDDGGSGGPSGDGEGSISALFLDGTDLFPGRPILNCVDVSLDTTMEWVNVRLHLDHLDQLDQLDAGTAGTGSNDPNLGDYFDVMIEIGPSEQVCDQFQPSETLFRGTLSSLSEVHGSFNDGLTIPIGTGEKQTLRFFGEVQSDNAAQGLRMEYLVLLEVRP